MEDNKFRDIIASKFDDLEGVPPMGGWNAIKEDLDKGKGGKRKYGIFWIPLAFLGGSLLFVGGYFLGKEGSTNPGMMAGNLAYNQQTVVNTNTNSPNNNEIEHQPVNGELTEANPDSDYIMDAISGEPSQASGPVLININGTSQAQSIGNADDVTSGQHSLTPVENSNDNESSRQTGLMAVNDDPALYNNSASGLVSNQLVASEVGNDVDPGANSNAQGFSSALNELEIAPTHAHLDPALFVADKLDVNQLVSLNTNNSTYDKSVVVLDEVDNQNGNEESAINKDGDKEENKKSSKRLGAGRIALGVYGSILNNIKIAVANRGDAYNIELDQDYQGRMISKNKIGFDLGFNAKYKLSNNLLVGLGLDITQMNETIHLNEQANVGKNSSATKIDNNSIRVTPGSGSRKVMDLSWAYAGINGEFEYVISRRLSVVSGLGYARLLSHRIPGEVDNGNTFAPSNMKAKFGLAYTSQLSPRWDAKIEPVLNYYFHNSVNGKVMLRPYNFGLRLNLVRK